MCDALRPSAGNPAIASRWQELAGFTLQSLNRKGTVGGEHSVIPESEVLAPAEVPEMDQIVQGRTGASSSTNSVPGDVPTAADDLEVQPLARAQ